MKKTPLLLATGLLLSLLTPGRSESPNFLIIYTDDQGSVDAGCYGAKDIETPTIDRLAKTGVRFTQMLAPSAICSSSRAGLMTGKIPPHAGVAGNVSSEKGHAGMPTDQVTIAEMLKGHGYSTGHVGKWHLGYTPETMPNGQGFDYSFGHMGGCIDNYSHFFYWQGPNRHDLWKNGKEIWREGEYFGDLMIEQTEEFITSHRDHPFLLYWAINWPHYPLQGTKKWREKYKNLPHPRDKYAAFVSSADEMIGTVIDHLEKLGLRENTVIIYQSDHGHSVEERTFGGGGSAGPYRGHKASLFEGGLRVPSVVSWPGHFPENEVRHQLVSGTDWFPTIAEIAGVEISGGKKIDGKSIIPVIRSGDAPTPHPQFYWRLGEGKRAQWAVREGSWKLLGNASEKIRPEGTPELTAEDKKLFLVNLEEDIGEKSNVVKSHPDKVKHLQKLREDYEKRFETADP